MKKFFRILSLTFIMTLAMVSMVYAAEDTSLKSVSKETKVVLASKETQELELLLSQTDAAITQMIQAAQAEAQVAMATLKDKTLEKELDKIIDELLIVTYDTVTIAIEKAATLGFVVERTWIPVEIGNRTVLVDPIRSVRY